jgi:hypothetical protein
MEQNNDGKIDALLRIRDGLRMAADAFDDLIQTYAPKEVQADIIPDLTRLVWTEKLGPHGVFEIAQDDSPGYADLFRSVNVHEGKMTLSGYFVWLLKDGKSIARKPARARQ